MKITMRQLLKELINSGVDLDTEIYAEVFLKDKQGLKIINTPKTMIDKNYGKKMTEQAEVK